MQFRVLGSLEVRRGDDLVEIGSSNERKVLAALLVDANAVVSTSRLIEVLWSDDPPASDRNALQTYVARLRRRLRTSATPAAIVTRPPGYAIELHSHQLDSLQFRELMNQARATLEVDPSRALEILDDALELWRGPAFAEFADDDVARAEAARLEELRQTAVENRVDALLALGRSAEAVSVLEGVVATHPLSERPHAQLMRALARCGRQVDALRLYQRFRERLADELGLEPSASLRDLEGHILTQAPHVAPAAAVAPSPPTEGNLAPPITTFVGREDDVAGLVGLLTRARVVTLVGVGGVGKSRLAIRLAETMAPAFPDGTWVVELARLSSPEAVPHAVAAALGVALPPGDDLWGALVDALRPRRMLLVVDNCEHVLHAASRLVDSLSAAAPRSQSWPRAASAWALGASTSGRCFPCRSRLRRRARRRGSGVASGGALPGPGPRRSRGLPPRRHQQRRCSRDLSWTRRPAPRSRDRRCPPGCPHCSRPGSALA